MFKKYNIKVNKHLIIKMIVIGKDSKRKDRIIRE